MKKPRPVRAKKELSKEEADNQIAAIMQIFGKKAKDIQTVICKAKEGRKTIQEGTK